MNVTDPVEVSAYGLLLRPMRPDDAPQVALAAADPEIARWNRIPEDVEEWCARRADWSDGTHASWAIVDPSAPEVLLGASSLHQVDRDQLDCEIGYLVLPGQRGRKVATRAVCAASEFAFGALGMRRITLFHAVANPASCGVARRAGYLLEGVHRQSHHYGSAGADNGWDDEHSHARLASDPAPSGYTAGAAIIVR